MSESRSQATPARDELAALILTEPNGWRLNRDNLADRILADGWSKPRTVNSAAELDALPVGSLVRAVEREGLKFGSVYEKTRHEWLHLDPADRDDGDYTVPSGAIVHCHTGGITVIFTPGDAG